MSVPAAKAPPAPRMMSTRTLWSASAVSQASTSASYISHVSALRASGRFNVTIPTDPLMSQATLLDGIVVLDATQVMAGPYCAMLLADMGARVIKVEPPAGDSTRAMAGARGNDSAAFNAVNRGKLGIVLDLNQQQGARGVHAPGPFGGHPGRELPAGRDGAPRPRLRSAEPENPRLIYASISGHGQTGPWATKGGFDLIAQGLSGLMSVTGDRRRARRSRSASRSPISAPGLFALIGILAALHHRSNTGRGPAHRHVARRCRARAVGVGSHRLLHDRPGAGAAWLGAPHDRAVPGVPLRGWLHHDRRAPTIATSPSSRACSGIPNG